MMPNNKPYLIGETAFHHEGDVDFLDQLVEEGIKLKLDAMKFHLLLDLDDYMAADHAAIDILRPWCLSDEQWMPVLKKIEKSNIDIILLCNDVKSLEWVLTLDIDIAAIELHATGLNDVFLLDKAAQFPNTVILGTGGSTLDEIDYAVQYLRERGQNDLFLMHGFQNYPTDFADIHLARMSLLKSTFNCPVGYADHTDPKDEDNALISCLPSGAGYNVLEKHFTHAYGQQRTDAQAAVSLDTMQDIQRMMKKAYAAYGSNPLMMSEAEKKYGNTGPMKKAIVARRELQKGHTLTLEDIAFKRTNESSPLLQKDLYRLLGNELKEDVAKDALLTYSQINYTYQDPDISQFKNSEK